MRNVRYPASNDRQPNIQSTWPKVLIVEDDPDLQTTITLRLKPYEIEVTQAFSGEQGIIKSLEQCPDLVVTDLAMPHGTGQYLIEFLGSHPVTRNIPVIAMSGMRNSSCKRAALSAGASLFLSKPLEFDRFIQQIGRFVDVRTNERKETQNGT